MLFTPFRLSDIPAPTPLSAFERLAQKATAVSAQPVPERGFDYGEMAMLYIVLPLFICLVLFVGYKVIKLIIKAYKKADRWLDK